MIWDGKNSKDKILVDYMGKQIPYVKSFDDVTKDAILLLKAQTGIGCIVSEGKVLVINVNIPDAKMIDKM